MTTEFSAARTKPPRIHQWLGGSGVRRAALNHQASMKQLANDSLQKPEKDVRRSERSEQFGFHADNAIAKWLNAYSHRVDCPTAAVIRASLIYFASATDPAVGRELLDQQINQGSLQEVLLLAAVRRIANRKAVA